MAEGHIPERGGPRPALQRPARTAGTPPLIVVFAVLCVVELIGVATGRHAVEWVAKPLLAPLLAAHLWRLTGTRHAYVLTGLLLAAAGDIALLIPGTPAFGIGLALFLGAQLCWITAFLRAGALDHLRTRRTVCAAHLAVWAAAVAALAPTLGPALGSAVAVYALALLTMALTARVLGPKALWGGLIFVASDSLIGLGAAGLDFPGRSTLCMTTYIAALALLVTAFTTHPRPTRTTA
ncbi:lysoplasmalogenase [Streptomyces murinus]|uniref:lysoplasmalogenase family protein n=1 Tax=Streptomyces murinus TaxID=33900 RepID=UPI002E802EEF|nr:lysoplasmalogenase family protein [Streptomyces murinus]WUD06970.1 lysoplasmalogenase [Streptomyces murinus]